MKKRVPKISAKTMKLAREYVSAQLALMKGKLPSQRKIDGAVLKVAIYMEKLRKLVEESK